MAYYKELALKGNDEAQERLGDCYRKGLGVKKDLEVALEWYKKAAKLSGGSAKEKRDALMKKLKK